jgi:hypothetical protein
VNHFTSFSFWKCYEALPEIIRKSADEKFELLKIKPAHPSLHFKKTGNFRSVRISKSYRALAVDVDDGLLWFWIGTHDDYKRMIRG